MPVCTEHSGSWDPSKYRHEAGGVVPNGTTPDGGCGFAEATPLGYTHPLAESLPKLPPVTPPQTLPPDFVPGTKRKVKTKRTDDAIESAAITDLKRRNLY